MTGHGQGIAGGSHIQVLTEIRTVNNRYLKINVTSDLDAEQQARIEASVRDVVQRGSVSVRVKVDRDRSELYRLNVDLIQNYQKQLSSLEGSDVNLGSLLSLPGVVEEKVSDEDAERTWEVVRQSVEEALAKLSEMRAREGQSMEEDLKANCKIIAEHLTRIEKLAPEVVDAYAQRMNERIRGLLEKFDINTQPAEVIREVGVFAERVDISEETVRLRSHLAQFDEIVSAQESSGRKLDFLIQEMLRETNTIGSKASHAEIAKSVVEIKTLIERLREMVQNVE